MTETLREADRYSHGDWTGVPVRPGDVVEVARPQRGDSPLRGRVTVGTVVEVGTDDGEAWALLAPGWARWVGNTRDLSPHRAEALQVLLDGAEVRHGADLGAIWAHEWLEEALDEAAEALDRAEAEADRLRGVLASLQDVNDARWRAERSDW